MPRIVVLVGAYNEEQYLGETIPAILNQTMPDFGLLLFDNGSTDATRDMCWTYFEHDERVEVARWPENLAPGAAFNLIRQSAHDTWPDCRWFLSHGADDVMHPDYLAAILDAAERNPDANLIFSPWSYLGGKRPDKRFPDYDRETIHAVHQIPAWSAITRELWNAVGPHNEELIASDWDWVMRGAMQDVIVPYQLDRPYLSLRVRDGARKSQSDEVHWPTLHRRFCEMVGKPTPDWAQNTMGQC